MEKKRLLPRLGVAGTLLAMGHTSPVRRILIAASPGRIYSAIPNIIVLN